MKSNKIVLAILSSLICLSLCACSKKDDIEFTGFGILEETKEEKSKSYGIGIDIELETEADPFSINQEIKLENETGDTSTETNIEILSEEDKSLDQAEKEAEPYLFTDIDGSVKDIREEAGYKGLLQYIDSYSDIGGIDLIAALPREENKDFLSTTYFLATDEEIDSILDIVYEGSEEEKQQLAEEALHTREGYVYTDEGWKNVYEETNSNIEGVGNGLGKTGGSYTPDDSFKDVEIHAY